MTSPARSFKDALTSGPGASSATARLLTPYRYRPWHAAGMAKHDRALVAHGAPIRAGWIRPVSPEPFSRMALVLRPNAGEHARRPDAVFVYPGKLHSSLHFGGRRLATCPRASMSAILGAL